jgi:hypothetical protein
MKKFSKSRIEPANFQKISTVTMSTQLFEKFVPVTALQTDSASVFSCFHPISRVIPSKSL